MAKRSPNWHQPASESICILSVLSPDTTVGRWENHPHTLSRIRLRQHRDTIECIVRRGGFASRFFCVLFRWLRPVTRGNRDGLGEAISKTALVRIMKQNNEKWWPKLVAWRTRWPSDLGKKRTLQSVWRYQSVARARQVAHMVQSVTPIAHPLEIERPLGLWQVLPLQA